MKKLGKRISLGFALLTIWLVCLTVAFAAWPDAPHNVASNNIGCTPLEGGCHDIHGWTHEPLLGVLCDSCHNPGGPGQDVQNHESAVVGEKYGTWSLSCTTCHNPHAQEQDRMYGTTYGKLIRDHITVIPNGTSIDHDVEFTAATGPASFADGDTNYTEDICNTCHTMTDHHQFDGTATLGQSHYDGENCALACHTHLTGFQPSDSCTGCHNQEQPSGGLYRRQIVENASDGNGDFVRNSHHVTNGTTNEIVTDDDCSICHDQSNHKTYTDGVTVLLNDRDGGASIVYDGTDTTLEPFCLNCHDGDADAPFVSGNTAKDIDFKWTGTPHETAGYTCYDDGSQNGCHANGHGSDWDVLAAAQFETEDYTPYATANYDLCWRCHSEDFIYNQNNKFGSKHGSHQDDEVTCAVCHDPHGPWDPGEGLVSFEWALNNDFDFSLKPGEDLSTSFWIDGTNGYCNINCHGKSHNSVRYRRTL